jgi:type IV pilus assembly protein PilQ
MKSTRYGTLLITAAVALTLATPLAQTPQRPPQRAVDGQAPNPAPQMPRRFSGQSIDVDYANADLRKVLRQVADIGGVNIAIDPSVPITGAVDLKLTQVPWDQVFDVVMQMNQLTNVVDGLVVRVLTREARTKELEDEARQKKASEKAPDLVTERLRINYASAPVLKKLIDQANLLSERGSAESDERANMLILKDVPATIAEIKKLVADLDQPELQVEIEARIIQTNHDTARELGVQWGFNGRVSPQVGNTTGLGFPNNGSLTGATTSGKAINMPAVGATSAMALAMGSINGALNLDVTLSALQHKGKLEILSNPKIVAQNNKPAEVSQGFQIPFQTVSNNTTTIQFKDAALKLTVTPHIASAGAGTVILDIELENALPDFSRAVDGNPSINTQRAVTQVQVSDGVTTAIGGILQKTDTSLRDSTPGMSRLPLIGWLFKRNADKNETNELMIFITPRIIR